MQLSLNIVDGATGPVTPYNVIYNVQLFKGVSGGIPDTPISTATTKAQSSDSGINTINLNTIFQWDYNDTIWFFVDNPDPIPMSHNVLSLQLSLFSLEQ